MSSPRQPSVTDRTCGRQLRPCTPVPAFYNRPETIDDIVDQTALRILDQFDFALPSPARWTDSTV